MELSEKIQKLRRQQGLTQEQFAQLLFVSRTAVSKWETGRGVPSMESLQMIAKLFNITLDQLVRADEIIAVAKNENRQNINRFACCFDGILNIAAVMGVLLPLYKSRLGGTFYSVPLYQFSGWLSILYWIFPVAMAVCGVIQIVITKGEKDRLKRLVNITGAVLNVCATLLLILSGQPYPAAMFFTLLLMKGCVLLIKRR